MEMGFERKPLIMLAPVAPGSSISVIAAASFARPERIERGLAAVEMLGYEPKPAPNALVRGPLFFAGAAAERLADLHGAFEDESTGFIMCLRGGYGSNYLLEGIDLAK